MVKRLALFTGLFIGSLLAADEQLTIQKVTVNTPSGTISGKVVGTGENLVFMDDNDPSKSFTLSRGKIRNYRTENGAILVEMERPATDQTGTVSNLRITVVDETNQATLTRWIGMPVERSRTATSHSTDVQHDHKGKGQCTGTLIADDHKLRFESVSDASHSRTWDYNDLETFDKEEDYALLKVVAKNGEKYKFKAVNGATAGAVYNLVSQKIVSNR